MSVKERALVFACEGETLVGVVSLPEHDSDSGVVIIVGGPQYRAGSHRQFVLLARRLAAAGHAVLRFDLRGMGDSSGAQRSFEGAGADVRAAIDALGHAVPAVRRIALWGLCDGASAALLYLDEHGDPRVHALCLANPWVRSANSLARTHVKHYYTDRLRQGAFWRKLLTGKVAGDAIKGFLRDVNAARTSKPSPALGYPQRMARAWAGFEGRILLLISGADYTAREFLDALAADPAWRGALDRRGVTRVDLPGADHTFSDPAARAAAEARTAAWLQSAIAAQPL